MGAVICLACTSSRCTLAARSVASRVLCRIRDVARRSPQLRQDHVSSADHPELDRMRSVLRENDKILELVPLSPGRRLLKST